MNNEETISEIARLRSENADHQSTIDLAESEIRLNESAIDELKSQITEPFTIGGIVVYHNAEKDETTRIRVKTLQRDDELNIGHYGGDMLDDDDKMRGSMGLHYTYHKAVKESK